MSEMVKRVAIAIGGLWNDRCNPCTAKKIVECDECLSAARLAIGAMKEPTDAMIDQGRLGMPIEYNYYQKNGMLYCDVLDFKKCVSPIKAYQFMIDEALKTGTMDDRGGVE